MKRFLCVFITAFVFQFSNAQTNIFPATGNVGIGTTSPGNPLTIIATNNVESPSIPRVLAVGDPSSPTKTISLGFNTTLDAGVLAAVHAYTGWKNILINPNGGNVGIGTTNPHAYGRLSISNGNIFMNNTNLPYAVGIFSTNATYLADNQYLDINNGVYKAASTGTSNRLQLHYSRGLSFFNGGYASTDVSVINMEVFRLSNTGGLSLGSNYVGTDPGAGNAIFSGNVGIGTISPASKLHLLTSLAPNYNDAANLLRLEYDGGYSPGTTGAGIVFAQRYYSGDNLINRVGGIYGIKEGVNGTFGGGLVFYTQQNSSGSDMSERMRISNDGSVSIGTTSAQGYKFAVNGNAIFTKVKVKPYPWSDYVFEAGYKLPTLKEVKEYIIENKHLPDVPSAKEVQQNGLDIGDNQAILLKKIEELTLYIIEQDKKIETITIENRQLVEIKKELEIIKAKLQIK